MNSGGIERVRSKLFQLTHMAAPTTDNDTVMPIPTEAQM